MWAKDRERLKVLHEVRKRHSTQCQAGEELGISPRWVRGLLKQLVYQCLLDRHRPADSPLPTKTGRFFPRHRFAAELLKTGVPLEDVSKLLGHRSVAVTEKHYSAWVKAPPKRG